MPTGVYERSEETKQKMSLSHLGIRQSEESKQKIRFARAKQISPMLGRHHSDETKQKIILALSGEKNHTWKGDNVGSRALHLWIRKHLPQPELCEFCNEKKRLDLANITGIYNRDFSNWKYLCRKCHLYYDGNVYNLRNVS